MLTTISTILALLAAVGIAYQDFKERLVSVWLLVALLLGVVGVSVSQVGFSQALTNWMINVSVLAVQLLIVFGYFYFKTRETGFIDRYLGMGDLVLLLVIAFPFTTINFMLFYSVGLVLTLAGYAIFRIRYAPTSIPLAGTLSICLILAMGFSYITEWDPWVDSNFILFIHG